MAVFFRELLEMSIMYTFCGTDNDILPLVRTKKHIQCSPQARKK